MRFERSGNPKRLDSCLRNIDTHVFDGNRYVGDIEGQHRNNHHNSYHSDYEYVEYYRYKHSHYQPQP